MTKKFMSVLLALVLCAGLLPTAALAEETAAAAAAEDAAGNQYETLQAAIDAASQGTIKLLRDISETDITVAAGKNVTIDLNGSTVTGDFMVYGQAHIKNGTIHGSRTGYSAVENNGAGSHLTLTDLTVTSLRHGVRVDGGTAVIHSGSYTTSGTGTVHGVNISTNANVTIHGGSFSGSPNANDSGAVAMRDSGSVLTVNGGTITRGHNAEDLLVWGGTATVKQGSIGSVRADGVVKLHGGTVTGALVNFSGDDTITGGSFTRDPAAYLDENHAAALQADGTYKVVSAAARHEGKGYATLQEAVNAAKDGDTVTLLQEVEETVTVDGKTVTFAGEVKGDKIALKLLNKGNVVKAETMTIPAPAGYAWVNNTLEVKAGEVAPKEVVYFVEHHKADGSGYVLADKETLRGEIGKQVTASPKSYTGFVYNAAKSTAGGTLKAITNIPSDPNALSSDVVVLKLYYDRAYTITKGDKQKVTQAGTAEFTSDADYGKFVKVLVDGKEIAGSSYTVVSGSTRVTLKSELVKTLKVGEHTIAIVSQDGEAKGTFTVEKHPVVLKFHANGGTGTAADLADRTVNYGESVGTLPKVTHEELYFAGWYTAKTGGERIRNNSVLTLTENTTLYAHWSTVPVTGDEVSEVQVAMLMAMLGLSLAGIAGLVVYKKRKEQ